MVRCCSNKLLLEPPSNPRLTRGEASGAGVRRALQSTGADMASPLPRRRENSPEAWTRLAMHAELAPTASSSARAAMMSTRSCTACYVSGSCTACYNSGSCTACCTSGYHVLYLRVNAGRAQIRLTAGRAHCQRRQHEEQPYTVAAASNRTTSVLHSAEGETDLVAGHGQQLGGPVHERGHEGAAEQLRLGARAGRPPEHVHELHQRRAAGLSAP